MEHVGTVDGETEELLEHLAALDRLAGAGSKEAALLWVKIVEPDPTRDFLTLAYIRSTVARLEALMPPHMLPETVLPAQTAEPGVLRPAA